MINCEDAEGAEEEFRRVLGCGERLKKSLYGGIEFYTTYNTKIILE
jgi:hypothetical protein